MIELISFGVISRLVMGESILCDDTSANTKATIKLVIIFSDSSAAFIFGKCLEKLAGLCQFKEDY